MFDQINTIFQFSKNALNLLAYRQKILSSNIANVDTPNYQALDVNFKDQLRQIIRQSNNKNLYLLNPSEKHLCIHENNIPIKIKNKKQKTLQENTSDKKNNVDINQERIDFIDNSLNYQIQMIYLNNEIKNIMKIIQG